MAERPKVIHDGFLVPNAALVGHPRMAEPDQVDFNTVAQARWGVIEGCLVTVSGAQAQCTLGGLALVNGKLANVVPGQSVGLGTGGSQDRFDLITVDEGGTLTAHRGDAAIDPIYPDPALTETVLAAVFVPTGVSNLSSYVIDKRKFVIRALLTKINPGDDLVRNVNGSGNHFLVTGAGTMTWGTDTVLQKHASRAATLKVTRHLEVDENVTAGGDLTARSLTASPGRITGSNFSTGSILPATAEDGAIFAHTEGRLYLRKAGVWKEMATLENATPIGTIITSVIPPGSMPDGWIALNGTANISISQYPTLFEVPGLGSYISGTGDNRVMTFPNAERRVLMTTWQQGKALDGGGSANNLVTLDTRNMPSHNHGVKVDQHNAVAASNLSAALGGQHGHGVTSSGEHGHTVTTGDHIHYGFDMNMSPVRGVGEFSGGRYKLDALFNDRNHPVTVDLFPFTMPAKQSITVNATNSNHTHTINQGGDHRHSISGNLPTYTHAVSEDNVGNGEPFDITPQFLTIYTYIRV